MKIYVHHKYNSEIFWYFFHGVNINPYEVPVPILDIKDKDIKIDFTYKEKNITAIFCEDRYWDKKDGRHLIDSHLFQIQKKLINNRGWQEYFIKNHLEIFLPKIKKHSERLKKDLDIFLIDWEGYYFLRNSKILNLKKSNLFLDEHDLKIINAYYPITQVFSSFLFSSGLPIRDFYYFADFLKLKTDYKYNLHYGIRRPTAAKIKNIEPLSNIKSDKFIITHSSYIHRYETLEDEYAEIRDYFENKVIPLFKNDSFINKRNYGIEDFGEELNLNNIKEMMWKFLSIGQVEIIDEHIENGFISEKTIIRILAEKPFIPISKSTINFYEKIYEEYNIKLPKFPLNYNKIEDIVSFLDKTLENENEWNSLLFDLKNYVSRLKDGLINIIHNNNSYLDFALNDKKRESGII